ncbi:TCP-1/cpn60 chaperonin family protein [Thermotalea metallivorans]|uniref:60 kDa chaperonin n=1 Tax=Thermotalea metallivorans TaxID=520762 RepID=A0A140L5N4_9FIRM|nr:TCP-1/cpn60 chaperonin family protein [Thermotalea metallivorans]KXG75859.1 60 kDa chaperonin [Thermotalea metallivorans]
MDEVKGVSGLHMEKPDQENRREINTALENNVQAVKAVVSAVEGTIGPKGMDCMIVDEEGQFIITNDGVTILMEMDVTHPAAVMMVNAAYAQQCQVGDGTTTMSVIAGAMLQSALFQSQRGVSVHKIIEGLRLGTEEAIKFIKEKRICIGKEDQELARAVARVAGRAQMDLVDLICQASSHVGEEKMKEKGFRFSDSITAIEGTENEVLKGIIIDRKPLNMKPVDLLQDVKILIVDDALQPEALRDELLNTENGFSQYIENRRVFENWIKKMIHMKIGAVFTDRSIDEDGEQALTDAGILVVGSVLKEQLIRLAAYTGARPVKRGVLNKPPEELEGYCGYAGKICYDSELEHIRIMEGMGEPMTTVIVSASTGAVAKEKERVAKDAASALQAAIKSGIVAGGGAIELACAIHLEKIRNAMDGLAKYGVDCVIDGLKKPIYHIVQNAGYNPLEKLERVIEAGKSSGNIHLGVDCEDGEVKDLFALGIVDPALVKIAALKTACEISEAILKIHLIIKGKNM